MKDLFYFMAIIFLFIEIWSLANYETVEFYKGVKIKKKEDIPKGYVTWLFSGLAYFIWTFIGLFMDEWPFFAGLFMVALLRHYLKLQSKAWHVIDSIICMALILGAIIKAFNSW
jgi:hypothetical protein